MAALEGLVATPEVCANLVSLSYYPNYLHLFDVLRTHTQGGDKFTSHVFHIAAFRPDGSIQPSCNESPAMYQVNWETLPLEIKKVCRIDTLRTHMYQNMHFSETFTTHPSTYEPIYLNFHSYIQRYISSIAWHLTVLTISCLSRQSLDRQILGSMFDHHTHYFWLLSQCPHNKKVPSNT